MTEPSSTRATDPALAPETCAGQAPDSQSVRWRPFLSAGSPREILSRIVPGDPLHVREQVADRLSSDALLLDADRVHLRALARCARVGARYTGRPELATWIRGIVGEAIDELLAEEEDLESTGALQVAEAGDAFATLARPLGLEPGAMQRACRAFNRLPIEERTAFFELVLRRRTLDEFAASSGESATELARRARRALEPFLRAQSEASSQPVSGPAVKEESGP